MLQKIKKYNKEEFQKLISESTSISELLKKIGYPGYGGYHTEMTKYLKESDYDTSSLKGRHIKRYDDTGIPKKWLSEVLVENSTGNSNKLKERLIQYGVKKYQCENPKCGITEWCGEPITLELHHINGNHYDNRLENLVLLCPNCHSQTTNFRGKNSDNSLNKKLSEIAIEESKTGMENLLKYEEERKEQIKLNKIKYGVIRKTEKKEVLYKTCEECGKEFVGRGEKFCSVECFNKHRQKEDIYDKNKILEESKTVKSICQLGRLYNLTDNGMRKILIRFNILNEVKENFKKR